MVFVRTLVQEKTGLKIDQPDPKGVLPLLVMLRRAFPQSQNLLIVFHHVLRLGTRKHFHNYIHDCINFDYANRFLRADNLYVYNTFDKANVHLYTYSLLIVFLNHCGNFLPEKGRLQRHF